MTTTGSTTQALDASWSRDEISLRSPAQQIVLASYKRSALTPEQYAERVIAFAESAGERARRAACQKRLDILRDAWGPLLKASLSNWLTPPVLAAVLGRNLDHIDLSRNPAKNIWGEQSVTYKLPPLRVTDPPQDGQRYVELLDEAEPDADLFFYLAELVLNACNEILIWPDVIERDGKKKIKHRYATGANVTIVSTENDPTEIECIDIIDEFTSLGGEKHCQHILWTREWHATFERNEDGAVVRVGYVPPAKTESGEDDPEKDTSYANPYGEIPKILVRRFPWGDSIWDQTSGEDLIDLTLRGGEERAFYRYQNKMGGFKQLLVTGTSVEDTPQQLLDQGAALKLEGQDVSAQVIDWQTNQKERLECAMIDETAAAASRGINPERYKHTANYASASVAKTSERGLEETRIRSSRLFSKVERRYKRLLCIVAKAHQIADVPDPEVKLTVIHAPLAYPEDPKTQLDVETAEIALGLESAVSIKQRRQPDLTEAEARESIEKTLADTARVNEMKTRANMPSNPQNESASAEQNGRMGPMVRDGQPPTGSPPDTNGETGAANGSSK